MNRIWVDLIIAGIAWGSGWMYGSSGAWSDGYDYGMTTMQLMIQGDPMTTDRLRAVESKLTKPRMEPMPPVNTNYYDFKDDYQAIPDPRPNLYDYDEMTPKPFQSRLSMIQGGRK